MSRRGRSEDEPLFAALSARSPSENLPLFLALARHQAALRGPRELLEQRARDPFVVPSVVDLRTALRFDQAALDVASDFEAVLLSPLAPLGVCAAVSPTTQDRAVATARGTEVVSDPTNVLALECARRLKSRDHVRLCTVHQVVRPQRFETQPGFSQHFRMFALAEAGLAKADHAFEVEAAAFHVALFAQLFDAFEAMGTRFPNRRAILHVAAGAEAIGDRIRERLAKALPGVPIDDASLASTYYDRVRVLFGAESAQGAFVPIADTGLFDWGAKLTSNRRVRFIASGMGIQLVPLLFRTEA